MATSSKTSLPVPRQSRLLPPKPGVSPPPALQSSQHNYQSLQLQHHRKQQPQLLQRLGYDVEQHSQQTHHQTYSGQPPRSGIPQSFSFVEGRQARQMDCNNGSRKRDVRNESEFKYAATATASVSTAAAAATRSQSPQHLTRQTLQYATLQDHSKRPSVAATPILTPHDPERRHGPTAAPQGAPYVALKYQSSPRLLAATRASGRDAPSESPSELDDAEKMKVLSQHIDIYTNWANHYLERRDHRRLISNLQWDFREGTLLADLIEAVVDEQVPNILRPTHNYTEVLQNTSECFNFLTSKQVDLRGIEPQDICQGNLKSILELFFSLSRYKQLQKQAASTSGGGGDSCGSAGSRSSPSRKKDGGRTTGGGVVPVIPAGPVTERLTYVGGCSSKMKELSGSESVGRRDKATTSASSSSSSAGHHVIPPEVSVEQNNNKFENSSEIKDSSHHQVSANKNKHSPGGAATDPGAKKTSMLTKLKLFGSKSDKKKEDGESGSGGGGRSKKAAQDVDVAKDDRLSCSSSSGSGSNARPANAGSTHLPTPQTRLPLPPPREPLVSSPAHPSHHQNHHNYQQQQQQPQQPPLVPERSVTLTAGSGGLNQTASSAATSSGKRLQQPQLPQRGLRQVTHESSKTNSRSSSSKDNQASLPRSLPRRSEAEGRQVGTSGGGTIERNVKKAHMNQSAAAKTSDSSLAVSSASSSSSLSQRLLHDSSHQLAIPASHPLSKLPNRTSSSTSISSMTSCGSSFTSSGGNSSLTKKSGSNLHRPGGAGARSSAIPGPPKKSTKLNTSDSSIVAGGAKTSTRVGSAKNTMVQRALSAKEESSKIGADSRRDSGEPDGSSELSAKTVSCSGTPLLDSSLARRIPRQQLKADCTESKPAVQDVSKIGSIQSSKNSSLKKTSKQGLATVRQLQTSTTNPSKISKTSNLQPLTESLPLKLTKDGAKSGTLAARRHAASGDQNSAINLSGHGSSSSRLRSSESSLADDASQLLKECSVPGQVEGEESNNSTSESTESVIYQPSNGSALRKSSKTIPNTGKTHQPGAKSSAVAPETAAASSTPGSKHAAGEDEEEEEEEEAGVEEESGYSHKYYEEEQSVVDHGEGREGDDNDDDDDDDDDGSVDHSGLEKDDHIMSLRRNKTKNNRKIAESPAVSTLSRAAEEIADIQTSSMSDEDFEIKPMEPFTRTTASSYMLRSSTRSSATGVGCQSPLIDVSKLQHRHQVQQQQQQQQLSSAILESDERAWTGDIISGYMSDGDILRSRRAGRQDYCASAFRRHTDDCGYTSEGGLVGSGTLSASGGFDGASAYAKRMQQRFLEGLMAAQECLEKKTNDDSSSGSSDDFLDEAADDDDRAANEAGAEPLSEGLAATKSTSSKRSKLFSGTRQHQQHPIFVSNRFFHPQLGQFPLVNSSTSSKAFPYPLSAAGVLNFFRTPAPVHQGGERRASIERSAFSDSWKNYFFSSSLDGSRTRPLHFERGIRERASLPIIGTHPGGYLSRRGLHPVPTIPEVVERVSPIVTRKESSDTDCQKKPSPLGAPVAADSANAPIGSSDNSTSASPTSQQQQQQQQQSAMKGSSPSINGSSLSISGPGRSRSKGARVTSPAVAEKEAMRGERLSNYSKGVMMYPGRSKVGQDSPVSPQQQQQQDFLQQQQIQQHMNAASLFGAAAATGSGTLRRRGSSGCADGSNSFKWQQQQQLQQQQQYTIAHLAMNNYNLDPSRLQNYDKTAARSDILNHHQLWSGPLLPVHPQLPASSTSAAAVAAQSSGTLTPRTNHNSKLNFTNKYAVSYDVSGKPAVPYTSSASLPRQNHHFHNIHQPRLAAATPTSPIYGGVGSNGSSSTVSPQILSRFQTPMSSAVNYGGQGYVTPAAYGTPSSSYHREESTREGGRGSTLSLGSSATSAYSNAEEQHTQEIRRLRQELENAQSKVTTLSTQLSTNAHVVSAFEQSLANMTRRLQLLTNATNQKDAELNELRTTIEFLKQQGARLKSDSSASGSAQSHRQSTGSTGLFSLNKGKESNKEGGGMSELRRHMSSDSVVSSVSGLSHNSGSTAESDKKKKQKSWLASFGKAFSRRKHQNSSANLNSGAPGGAGNKSNLCSDADSDTGSLYSDASMVVHLHAAASSPHHPLLHHGSNGHPLSLPTSPIRGSKNESMLTTVPGHDSVTDLQQQLREKDMKLTDIQLEALSSAHQLEHLKETMNRMKNEMLSLKVENDRMQQIISKRGSSTHGSPSSPPASSKNAQGKEQRLSLGDPSNYDLLLVDSGSRDSQKITLSVRIFDNKKDELTTEIMINTVPVSGATTWDTLLTSVKAGFKDYLGKLDSSTGLGLNTDSIAGLKIGDVAWNKASNPPEFLPCGYLVGESTNISLLLKGSLEGSVDALSFETLIPKPILLRYVSLLADHRRLILCGPSGTGKTFLAQKLAEHIVISSGKPLKSDTIAMFNVDHKTGKELRQYLSNIADQCEHGASDLPDVIILDSLHHVASLREVFDSFLSVKNETSPYIIGTMSQAANSNSSTNLQLHHNFRWVLCANHVEPVRGFLGRFLKRKMIEAQVGSYGVGEPENEEVLRGMSQVIEWLPKVWQHLNKCLEAHSSSEVTIGPRLFLSCPMELDSIQTWFTDLWNYSIVPYLLEAIREGIQTYGSRVAWEDPADWVIKTFPWTNPGTGNNTLAEDDWPPLLKMRPEDVGYDAQNVSNLTLSSSASNSISNSNGPATPLSPNLALNSAVTAAGGILGQQHVANKNSSLLSQLSNPNETEDVSDPLLNMLLRLQEAASYTSPSASDVEFASTGTTDKSSSTYSMVDQI